MPYTIEKSNYKNLNPYYYSTGEEENLLPDEVKVNSIIKPIDREDSNVEIEKGEIVLHPNGNLLKATGKTHARGGTPVSLPENSFIFSNFKPLAIDKEDKELFKFQSGGKWKPKTNTPAKLLSKEVDLKHHNRMVAIQDSDTHDGISKKSSELMLTKNFKKAGQIAFLQEEKKGFPEGMPDFSQGTAPVGGEQNMNGQFMQMGGPLSSRRNRPGLYDPSAPMTRSDNWKLWRGDKLPIFQNQFGVTNAADKIGDLDALSNELGYTGAKDNQSFQNWLYNSSPENANIIDKWHSTYDEPNIGRPRDERNRFDGKIGIRWTNAINEIRHRHPDIVNPNREYTIPGMNLPQKPSISIPDNPYAPIPGQPGDELDTLPYNPEVPLTPDQKLSLGVDAYNFASINKYAPKRMQFSYTPDIAEDVNFQPIENTINNQTQQAYKATQAMNPYIARANNSNVYGRGLETISQAAGQNYNANRGNRQAVSARNNQGINAVASQNVQADNTYYNQVQALNQNYDNEKRFAGNRLSDKYMQYRSENDALKFQLASQPTFGSIDVYQNPSTGETSKLPRPGWIKRKQAAPLYDYNARRNSVYFTGAGMDLDQLPTTTQSDPALLKFQQAIVNGTATEADKLAYSRLYKSINPYQRSR